VNTDRELILSAVGRQLFKIGENAWKWFTADPVYNVTIEWHTEARKAEPCMCIWAKSNGSDAAVFAITLGVASMWGDASGNPAKGALLRATLQLEFLGRNVTMDEAKKLLSVVMRHLPDLLNCPPAPPAVRRAEAGPELFEMTVKTEDGKTVSQEVI
jgi:hypothetical protein